MLDKYFAAHAAAQQAEAEGNWQLARDHVGEMQKFVSATSFKPEKLSRGEAVFADYLWGEYLDGRGIKVSTMAEMAEDMSSILTKCTENDIINVKPNCFLVDIPSLNTRCRRRPPTRLAAFHSSCAAPAWRWLVLLTGHASRRSTQCRA